MVIPIVEWLRNSLLNNNNIAHCVHSYYPSIGGSQEFIKQLSEGMQNDYGYNVTVFSTNALNSPHNYKNNYIEELNENINNVKVNRYKFLSAHIPFLNQLIRFLNKVGLKKFSKTISLFRNGPISYRLIRDIVFSNNRIVLCTAVNYLFIIIPSLIKLFNRNKIFILHGALHIHDYDNEYLPRLVINSIRSCDLYIANTEFEKKYLINKNIRKEAILVSGCGVNLVEYQEPIKRDYRKKFNLNSSFVVGYLGRIAPSKGIDDLIDSFVMLIRDGHNLSLIIAGSHDGYLDVINKKINGLDKEYKEKINFIIDFDDGHKADIIKSFDCFVNPSYSESFGIVFLEAWACKKPVIGSNIGAVNSLISKGHDGLVFDKKDPASLAKKIEQIVLNDNLRLIMGTNGYNKVKENYTWPIVISKIEKAYRGLIE